MSAVTFFHLKINYNHPKKEKMTRRNKKMLSQKNESDEKTDAMRYGSDYNYIANEKFNPYQRNPYSDMPPSYYGQEYGQRNPQFLYANAYPDVYAYNNPAYFPRNARMNYAGMSTFKDGEEAGISEDSCSYEEKAQKNVRIGGKKKVCMKYIESKSKRGVTFSKRKKGIMKKAYELNILTGTQILLLVASESGHVYTFATPKLRPIISEHENLIQQCLNAPPASGEDNYFGDYDCFLREPSMPYDDRKENAHHSKGFYNPKK